MAQLTLREVAEPYWGIETIVSAASSTFALTGVDALNYVIGTTTATTKRRYIGKKKYY